MDARLKLIELYSKKLIAELEQQVKHLEMENRRLNQSVTRLESENRWLKLCEKVSRKYVLADFHAAFQKSKEESGLDD